ncbi:hypothetical protein M1555_05725 [Patescibacteria group bacterium]|nr:hypothetical protein [Patescibacteria group bacterium]
MQLSEAFRGYSIQEGSVSDGIPWDELDRLVSTGFTQGEVITKSGHTLSFDVAPYSVRLTDAESSDYLMEGDIEPESGVAQFHLYTRSPADSVHDIPKYHPDFHAESFVGIVLLYFECQGYPVSRIHSRWDAWGSGHFGTQSNYAAFRRGLINTSDIVSIARSTPSGMLYNRFGFTVNSRDQISISSDWSTIEVLFEKEM